MTGLEIYLIFALTTAIAGVYELVMPVIWVLKGKNPEITVVKHSWITYLASAVLIFIVAPLFFPLVIIPKMGATFRHALHKSFLNNQE